MADTNTMVIEVCGCGCYIIIARYDVVVKNVAILTFVGEIITKVVIIIIMDSHAGFCIIITDD